MIFLFDVFSLLIFILRNVSFVEEGSLRRELNEYTKLKLLCVLSSYVFCD